MTPDERALLQRFLQDLVQTRGANKDAEADSMIRDALRASPDAPYVLVQHAILSDQALHAAQDQIAYLQEQLHGTGSAPPASAFSEDRAPVPRPQPLKPSRNLSRSGSPSLNPLSSSSVPGPSPAAAASAVSFATREPRPPAWPAGRFCSKAFPACLGADGAAVLGDWAVASAASPPRSSTTTTMMAVAAVTSAEATSAATVAAAGTTAVRAIPEASTPGTDASIATHLFAADGARRA